MAKQESPIEEMLGGQAVLSLSLLMVHNLTASLTPVHENSRVRDAGSKLTHGKSRTSGREVMEKLDPRCDAGGKGQG